MAQGSLSWLARSRLSLFRSPKEMFLNRAGARRPGPRQVIAARRHGHYARPPGNENQTVTLMALVPPYPWFQSGTAWQSFPMLDEGFWAEIKVDGEHLRLFSERNALGVCRRRFTTSTPRPGLLLPSRSRTSNRAKKEQRPEQRRT